ncbi:MAG: hypothetical protein ITG02_07875 [Patulibacter sp.]|nr:hypothetical protein [Patulibacter sp.]
MRIYRTAIVVAALAASGGFSAGPALATAQAPVDSSTIEGPPRDTPEAELPAPEASPAVAVPTPGAPDVEAPSSAPEPLAADDRCWAWTSINASGVDVLYTGTGVDCRLNWTYSFRLRYKNGGTTLDEYILEGKTGSSFYSLPTFSYLTGIIGGVGCSELRVYHSSTVGQNLIDTALSCIGGVSRRPN